jgi:SAM-dependent methyltransferase
MVQSVSWDWNNLIDSHWTKPSEEAYFLLHHWNAQRYSTILDLGCGVGRHSLLFAQHGFDVTALDLSSSGLQILANSAQKLKLPIRTIQADVAALPFEDASFDAILAYHSMYHVDSDGMLCAVHEVHRVLRPNGEAFLTFTSKATSSYSDPECQILDGHVRMKREEDGSVLPHYFCDQEDIHRLLAKFKIIKLRHVEDIVNGKSSWHYFVHLSI